MTVDNKDKDFEKQKVDEDYWLNVIDGGAPVSSPKNDSPPDEPKEPKPKEKVRSSAPKKVDYEETFLVNRFPSGRNGKVVYIRPEYHERLLRIVQLTRDEKTTLYSYIDNIIALHFKEYEDDVKNYFDKYFKPII